jgi:hypothetical protein
LESAVHRDRPPSAAFSDALSEHYLFAHGRIAAEDHFPLEPRYLTGTQAGLEAQQNHHSVPLSVTTLPGVLQKQIQFSWEDSLCRLPLASLPVSPLVFGTALTIARSRCVRAVIA